MRNEYFYDSRRCRALRYHPPYGRASCNTRTQNISESPQWPPQQIIEAGQKKWTEQLIDLVDLPVEMIHNILKEKGMTDDMLRTYATQCLRRKYNIPKNRSNVTFSPDGQYMAYNDNNTLYVKNLETNVVLLEDSLEEDYIDEIAFSPGSSLLATVGGWRGKLTIYHLTPQGSWVMLHERNNAPISKAYPRSGFRYALQFSPSGRILAFFQHSGVSLWDTTSGTKIDEQQMNSAYFGDISFSPNEKAIIGIYDRRNHYGNHERFCFLYLLRENGWEMLVYSDHNVIPKNIAAVSGFDTNENIAIAYDDGLIQIIESVGWDPIATITTVRDNPNIRLKQIADLVLNQETIFARTSTHLLVVSEQRKWEPIVLIQDDRSTRTPQLDISRDRRQIATSYENNMVGTWKANSEAEKLADWKIDAESVESLTYLDNNDIAVITIDEERNTQAYIFETNFETNIEDVIREMRYHRLMFWILSQLQYIAKVQKRRITLEDLDNLQKYLDTLVKNKTGNHLAVFPHDLKGMLYSLSENMKRLVKRCFYIDL